MGKDTLMKKQAILRFVRHKIQVAKTLLNLLLSHHTAKKVNYQQSDYSDSYKPDLRFFRIYSEKHKKMKLSHQSLAPNLRLIKKGGRVRILVKIGLFNLKAVYNHTYDWFIST